MGTTHNHLSPELKVERMIQRFHGIDRHKISTISVLNREEQEVQFLSAAAND